MNIFHFFRRRLWLATLLMVFTTSALSDTYVVITSKDNPISGSPEELKPLVRSLFLKQIQEWPNGIKAKPFNHREMAVYEKFIIDILGMDTTRIEEYWLGKKQKTGETPPRVGPEKLLAKLVAKSPGGVSYITKSSADQFDDIRILFEF